MRRIKLLHIITRLDKGGSAENTLLTCIGLDKERFDVSLLVGETIDTYEDLITEAESKGVHFVFMPELVRSIKPFRDIRVFFKIFSFIKRKKFDIVHTHSSKAGFIGRLAAKLAHTSIILYTPHGHIFYGYFNRFLNRLFIYIEKLAATFTDKIITLTETGKDEWVKFGIASRNKFIAIHSGMRFKAFKESAVNILQKKKELNISSETKVVGTGGRFVGIKGHKYLVEAIPEIINSYPQVLFILIGDGPLKMDLQRKAQILGVKEKIKFLGWREDLIQILQIIDVFVFPSLNEGMGRVLVEAQVCSKPVVATKVGGISDVVIDNQTGFLVSPRDSNALAKAVIKLLKDGPLAEKMGKQGKEWILSKFTAEDMVNRIERLYEDLLKNNKKDL